MTPDAKLMLLIPLSEYLSRTYDPDCEYLEGELKERHVGEVGHSDAQSSVLLYVRHDGARILGRRRSPGPGET